MSAEATRRTLERGRRWRSATRRWAAATLASLALLAQACEGGERIEVRQTVPYGRRAVPAAHAPPGPAPLASAPAADSFGEDALLYRMGESPCAILRAGLDGLAAGLCGEELSPRVYLRPDRPLRLGDLIARYAPFELEEGDEKVVLNGRGSEVAGAVERRLVLEWARRLMAEANGVAGTRGYRLAFEWHRQLQGGQGCDAVTVYLSGEALATTCDGLRSTGTVAAAQMGAILAWHDEVLPFQVVRERREGGDAVSTRLIVPGAGQSTQDAGTVRSMISLAEAIHREVLASDLLRREEEERRRLAALEPAPTEQRAGRPPAAAPPVEPTAEVEAADLTLGEAIGVGIEPSGAAAEGEVDADEDLAPPPVELPPTERQPDDPPAGDEDDPGDG